MLTNAMNGSRICILFGSSVEQSTLSVPLITMNNLEMAGCSSPDSYVLKSKATTKTASVVKSRIKATLSVYSFYSALELGQECSAPNPVISLLLVLIL